MTPDMIPLLVALTFDENYNKYGLLKGNMPLKKQPRKLFYSSGFLNLVQTDEENRQEIDPSHCHLTNDLLSGEEAEGKEAANACDRIAEQTFEDTGMPVELDFYSLLVEVITNTKNHASPLAPIKWWIYTHNDTTTGNTSCTVLDLGSGIFRGHSGRVKGFVDKIFELFNRKASHQEIAKAILDGSIISSKEEDQDRRGKGLQQILNISKSRYIARAVLYSNDIKIDLQNDVSETLAIELEGTFYHFEITNPNK